MIGKALFEAIKGGVLTSLATYICLILRTRFIEDYFPPEL